MPGSGPWLEAVLHQAEKPAVAALPSSPVKYRRAVQCSLVSTLQCNAVQCSTVQCSEMQYTAVESSAVQCSAF